MTEAASTAKQAALLGMRQAIGCQMGVHDDGNKCDRAHCAWSHMSGVQQEALEAGAMLQRPSVQLVVAIARQFLLYLLWSSSPPKQPSAPPTPTRSCLAGFSPVHLPQVCRNLL